MSDLNDFIRPRIRSVTGTDCSTVGLTLPPDDTIGIRVDFYGDEETAELPFYVQVQAGGQPVGMTLTTHEFAQFVAGLQTLLTDAEQMRR